MNHFHEKQKTLFHEHFRYYVKRGLPLVVAIFFTLRISKTIYQKLNVGYLNSLKFINENYENSTNIKQQ